MRFRSLGSGSSGNASVVEATLGLHTSRVLVDCGLGIRQLEARLGQAGLQASQLDAVFITHEHADHIGCAFAFASRYALPLWMSRGTFAALGPRAENYPVSFASDCQPIEIGALELRPFTVPHDAREPLQLRCTNGQRHLGILTDLGHVSGHVAAQLAGVHALLLECNHDRSLLKQSSYPPFLKARVGGRLGHLCNEEAALLAQALNHNSLGHVVAAHLSEQNNRPELAQQALALALGRQPSEVLTANASEGCVWLDV